MKKTVLLFFVVLSLLCASVFGVSAAPARFRWYCVHVKDHKQPSLGAELAFIEELGGYYIDRRHTDAKTDDKVVYLTFDAGYENGNVAKILDILHEENVPAAFFVLQNLIVKNTDLIKRMVDEGHTVCNHTARHKDMSTFSNEAFLEELHTLEALYREHIGAEMPKYYRPPEGSFSRDNLVCANENGYKTVFWSFAYPDWDNNKQMSTEKAKQIILENVHNGEVMLLHPTSSTNAAILQDVIRTLKERGYRFGTLDELTGANANE